MINLPRNGDAKFAALWSCEELELCAEGTSFERVVLAMIG